MCEEPARTATNSQLFNSLGDQERGELFRNASRVPMTTGEVIVREGDPGESLYLINSGRVRVITSQQNREVLLAYLGPGACFGEVALLSGNPRTATIVADGAGELLRFSRESINRTLDAHPKIRRRLEAVIAGRARDTIEKITRPPLPVVE